MRRLMSTCCVGLLAACASVTAAGQELVSRDVLDGKVTLLLPVAFEPMSEDVLRAKYPNRVPSSEFEAFTSADTLVNVALDHTAVALTTSALAEAHSGFEQALRTQFPAAKWNRSEVLSKNGTSYFILDLVTPAVDTQIRNIMFGTSLQERFLLVTFNCTQETEAVWAPLGQRIIDSIAIHP